MVRIPPDLLKTIMDAAEAAFPRECCGLLAGRGTVDDDGVTVTHVMPAANVTEGRAEDSFEVDPQARFDLHRALEGSDERLVGHYHSHPNGPARPSATDLQQAYEPDLVWLIVGVRDGQAIQATAHALADGAFHEIPLHTTDRD